MRPGSVHRIFIIDISRDLAAAGFLIERFLEPRPVAEFRQLDSENHDRLSKNPWFIVIRAVKEMIPGETAIP